MKHYNLTFQGYTWDEYFYVISDRQGILITYIGSLDKEGALQMNEVIYIEGAEKLKDIYEGKEFQEIRERIKNEGKLFFSYAEVYEDIQEIVEELCLELKPRFNTLKSKDTKISVSCKGCCSLFPSKMLY